MERRLQLGFQGYGLVRKRVLATGSWLGGICLGYVSGVYFAGVFRDMFRKFREQTTLGLGACFGHVSTVCSSWSARKRQFQAVHAQLQIPPDQ